MDKNKMKLRWFGMVCAGLFAIAGCGSGPGPTPTPTPDGGTVTGCPLGCDRGFVCQASSCVLDPTGRWVVRVTSGTVATRNGSGGYWDADFSAPDPKVCLTINGNRTCTKTIQDTHSPVWDTDFPAAAATALQAGANIEYLDTDLTSDDPICSGTLSVKSSDFADGTWGFTCQGGLGQVSARLTAQ